MSAYICKNCGKEVEKGAAVCPYCGASLGMVMGQVLTSSEASNMKAGDLNNRAQIFYSMDNGSFHWIVLGLLLPPVGILLYFLKRKSDPRMKNALIGAVMSLIAIGVVVSVHVAGNIRRNHMYPEWIDYSSCLGKDRAQAEAMLEKKGLKWQDTDGGIKILGGENIAQGHLFSVTLYFASDGHMSGLVKEYYGSWELNKDFAIDLYKKLHKLHGTPEQEAVPEYDTPEQFYEGMLTEENSGARISTAIWKKKDAVLDIQINASGKMHMKYMLFNKPDKPAHLQ